MIKAKNQPDIEVCLDSHRNDPFMCVIAMLENMVTIQSLAVGRAARAINELARFTHAPEKARAARPTHLDSYERKY